MKKKKLIQTVNVCLICVYALYITPVIAIKDTSLSTESSSDDQFIEENSIPIEDDIEKDVIEGADKTDDIIDVEHTTDEENSNSVSDFDSNDNTPPIKENLTIATDQNKEKPDENISNTNMKNNSTDIGKTSDTDTTKKTNIPKSIIPLRNVGNRRIQVKYKGFEGTTGRIIFRDSNGNQSAFIKWDDMKFYSSIIVNSNTHTIDVIPDEDVTHIEITGGELLFVNTYTQNSDTKINYSLSETLPTKNNVTITFTATDPDGIHAIWINGNSDYFISQKGDNSVSFTVNSVATVSKKYFYMVRDKYGNEYFDEISISNIDREGPNLDISKSTHLMTNKNVILKVTASDNISGVKSIEDPDGNINNSDNILYEATENKTYVFKSIDNLGTETIKTITVDNIDKVNPNIKLSPLDTGWVKSESRIKVDISDNNNNGLKLVLPNKAETSKESTIYKANSNGEYAFKVIDIAGNETVETINISNIDDKKPDISVKASKLKDDNTIDINIKVSDFESGLRSIVLPTGDVINKDSATVNIGRNGLYRFEAIDMVGNRKEISITIDSIKVDSNSKDTEAPTINYSLSEKEATNKDVTINILALDNRKVDYIILPNNEKVYGSNAIFIAKNNEDYLFRAVDTSGNISNIDIPITNIDKEAVNVSINQSHLLPDKSIDLEVNVTNKVGSINEIVIDGNENLPIDLPIMNVTKNGHYRATVKDISGNIAIASTEVISIPFTGTDDTSPELDYTLSKETWTNETVNITIYAKDNDKIASILLPDGTSSNSSLAEFKASKNGNYEFTAIDASGNENKIVVAVDNIDIGPLNKDNIVVDVLNKIDTDKALVEIKVIDSLSGIKSITLPNNIIIKDDNISTEIYYGKDFDIVVVDNAGNIHSQSINIPAPITPSEPDNNENTKPDKKPGDSNNDNSSGDSGDTESNSNKPNHKKDKKTSLVDSLDDTSGFKVVITITLLIITVSGLWLLKKKKDN